MRTGFRGQDPWTRNHDAAVSRQWSVLKTVIHILGDIGNFPFSFLLMLFLTACSVQIYDLQPIIIGTNTPTPTEVQRRVYVGTTPTVSRKSETATPPVHIAPTAISSMTAVNILEITMIDGSIGWGIGQIPGEQDKLVLRTTNTAEHWKNVTPSQVIYDYAGKVSDIAACFRDGTHAWLIFRDPEGFDAKRGVKIWFTDDGGTTWNSADLPVSGYSIQRFDEPQIKFLDNQTGWIFARIGQVDEREFIGLYTTHDGGVNWSPMITTGTANLPSATRKNGAVFRDTLEGWITGENSMSQPGIVLWHTFDGGNTWYEQMFPEPWGYNIPTGLLSDPSIKCSLDVPKFVDFQYQYAWTVLRCNGGSLSEPVSILYWTYDRLSTWKTVRLPAAEGDLSFYGIEYGWYAVQNAPGSDFPYQILFTEDGGTNWRTASQLAWDSKLQFLTPSIGYGIVTYYGQPALVKTSNSGFSWEQIFAFVIP
ncbi:MAG: hypothetical protein IJI41_05370 [Anaerolineaceae bacterium]|nr:hypothetical protein [Anaerolineaceae bacterium]